MDWYARSRWKLWWPLLVVFLVGGALTAVVVTLTRPAEENQDRGVVVGVSLKCGLAVTGRTIELSGDECDETVACKTEQLTGKCPYRALNRRLVITVKPSTGAVYTAELYPEAVIIVGDPWPPK